MASFDVQAKWFAEDAPVNANEASATLTFDGVVSDGDKVTIGDNTYEYDNNDTITSGNIAIDMTHLMPKASGVFTFTDVAVVAETVTIGTETYEFVADAGDVTPDNIAVVLEAPITVDSSIMALTDAINLNSEIVMAVATLDDDLITISALGGGVAGNSIGTTTTCTKASFAKATLEGGLDTITAANACVALETAIALNETMVNGIADTDDGTVVVAAIEVGTEGNSIDVLTTATNGDWGTDVTALSGGAYGTVCPVPNAVVKDDNYMYICIAPNSKHGKNWRRFQLAEY